MALWTINGVDVSDRFGVYLKKGAYNVLFSYPSVKSYLTEDVRESDGENVVIHNPKKQARNVTMSFYMDALNSADFWTKYNAFISFLIDSGLFEFKLCKHNRIYMMYYVGCESFNRNGSFDKRSFVEFSITLREPNTNDVFSEEYLSSETNADIITESGEKIITNVNIY